MAIYLAWQPLILVMCVNVPVHDPIDDMAASVFEYMCVGMFPTAYLMEKEPDISMSYLLGKVEICKCPVSVFGLHRGVFQCE